MLFCFSISLSTHVRYVNGIRLSRRFSLTRKITSARLVVGEYAYVHVLMHLSWASWYVILRVDK